MRQLRIYVETSVFGGCFDLEFAEASQLLFDHIRHGRFRLVISDTILLELQHAPEEVRRVLTTIPPDLVERITLTDEIERLRDAYVDANVVGPASRRDAEHIASATVADVDLIVSWNFRHIVHYDKISGYHGVNLLNGYKAIRIFSPLEVI